MFQTIFENQTTLTKTKSKKKLKKSKKKDKNRNRIPGSLENNQVSGISNEIGSEFFVESAQEMEANINDDIITRKKRKRRHKKMEGQEGINVDSCMESQYVNEQISIPVKMTTVFMTQYDVETAEERLNSVLHMHFDDRNGTEDCRYEKQLSRKRSASNDDFQTQRQNRLPTLLLLPSHDCIVKQNRGSRKRSYRESSPFSLPINFTKKLSRSRRTDNEKTDIDVITMPPPIKRPPRSPSKLIDIDVTSANKSVLPRNIALNSDIGPNKKEEREFISSMTSVSSESEKILSTYQLLTHPDVFKQGMDYLSKLAAKEMDAAEVNEQLGISVPDGRIDFGEMSQNSNSDGNCGQKIVSKVAESDFEENGNHELVRELMCRKAQLNKDQQEFDNADIESLPERSMCMANFVPGYIQKRVAYKSHVILIQSMTPTELAERFDSVCGELKGIHQGVVRSTRHSLYQQGSAKKRQLLGLNVSIPFTSQHAMFLISFLYDFLFPDDDDRLEFAEYITFVMLPETYIRIYAKVTDLTYDMAQQEMRFGPCYDDRTFESP